MRDVTHADALERQSPSEWESNASSLQLQPQSPLPNRWR
jgi:hypothetical protein